MWKVVHMANTRKDAELVETILTEEGFLVKVKPVTKDQENGICEIAVLESEVEEAHSILLYRGL